MRIFLKRNKTAGIAFILLVFLLGGGLAQANVKEPETLTLTRLLTYSKDKNPDKAKDYITGDSHEIYHRLYSHDLTDVIPNAAYQREKKIQNGFTYVWFSDDPAAKEFVVIAYAEEDQTQKISLPETFRLAFGENWPKKLDLIESSYLFLKAKYGEKQSKAVVKQIIGKPE